MRMRSQSPRSSLGLRLAAAAVAPLERPNALDRRVDALAQRALLREPATALVDPARQAAAIRRAHWTLPGWVLDQLFGARRSSISGVRGAPPRCATGCAGAFAPIGCAFCCSARRLRSSRDSPPSARLLSLSRRRDDGDFRRAHALCGASRWRIHTLLGMIVAGIHRRDRALAGSSARINGTLHDRRDSRRSASYGPTSARTSTSAGLAAYSARRRRARCANSRDAHARRLRGTFRCCSRTFATRRSVKRRSRARRVAYDSARPIRSSPATRPGDRVRRRVRARRTSFTAILLAIALIEGGIIIVFAALAVVIADRIGFRRDDDPLSRLAIVGALLALVYLAAVPVRNAALRSYDFSADRYAVALTGDPSAAVRALVRASDQRMEEVCPELTAHALSLRVARNRRARRRDQSRSSGGCPVDVPHVLTKRIAGFEALVEPEHRRRRRPRRRSPAARARSSSLNWPST